MEFTREVTVLKGPRSKGTLEQIRQQVEVSLELRDAMNLAVSLINAIEDVRNELESLIPQLKKKIRSGPGQRPDYQSPEHFRITI